MPSPRENIFAALNARLSVLPATARCGDVPPERVPAEGLLILHDGETGEPELRERCTECCGNETENGRGSGIHHSCGRCNLRF